ncbi:hypothetical protein [Lacihabitans lacunae]|uniref:DUF11 domain-containing protein n=1 Tax=Lacihabitans lacunae TaxID=1028214 RepID=A0ABV7YW92_9BACT
MLKPIQRNASKSGTKLNDHENTSRRPKPSDDTGHNQLRSSGSKHRKPKPNERSVSDTLPNGTIGTLVKTNESITNNNILEVGETFTYTISYA